MIKGKKALAFIPARGNSKGIPGKNLIMLGGKPLIAHTIEAAGACSFFDTVLVSTDSVEIAQTAEKYGAEVPFLRPAELAADTSKTIDAVLYTLKRLAQEGREYDYLVLLQPTSPLRTAADIRGALRLALESGQDVAAVSGVEDSPILVRSCDASGRLTPLLPVNSTMRRQDMPEYYRVNGSIYVNRVCALSEKTSLNDNPMGYRMPRERSVDIDERVDLAVAQYYLEQEGSF